MSDIQNIPKEVLKKNKEQNQPKTTKQERRKKLHKFKDEAKKAWGKPFTSVGICLKDCANKYIRCWECYRFNCYKEIK